MGILFTISCNSPDTKNPLLEEYDTPFQTPPFNEILPEHFLPAITEAMAQHNAEIDAIVTNSEPPTFENTIAAYDRSGRLLSRVSSASAP
jgi:peptidyl-dipeptidase Dcp